MNFRYVLSSIKHCRIELLEARMLWLFITSSALWCADILMATSRRRTIHLSSTTCPIAKYIQTLIELLLALVKLTSIDLLASLTHELLLTHLFHPWRVWCLSMQSVACASGFAGSSLSTLWVRFSRSALAAIAWNTGVAFAIFELWSFVILVVHALKAFMNCWTDVYQVWVMFTVWVDNNLTTNICYLYWLINIVRSIKLKFLDILVIRSSIFTKWQSIIWVIQLLLHRVGLFKHTHGCGI